MLENKKDTKATKELRRRKIFQDDGSWISMSGHVYLEGLDKSMLRAKVAFIAKMRCAICGDYCMFADGDLEHIKGGSKLARCDCYRQQLTNGTIHTNVQWCHGMLSTKPCHREKHNREVTWTKKDSS